MAGRGSWSLLTVVTALALLQPVACDPPEVDDGISEQALALALAPVAEQVTAELAAFRAALSTLDEALAAWRTSLDSGDGATELDAARVAYLDTMAVWQRLEVLQIGPQASSLTGVGGEDLRDEVYSWPEAVSGCRVDTETVEAVWDDADFFTSNLVNSYGLDALEHLLYASPTTECPSQVGIQAGWDALGSTGVAQNRAAYSESLVDHLDGVAADLEARWSGDLGLAFAAGDAPWASSVEAVNALYDGLFYLETRTKDRKLAEPLSLRDCTVDCEALVESRLSGASIRWIRENLISARQLVAGGENDGLDALLVEVGHGDIGTELDAALATAIATAEGLDGAMDTLIASDAASVEALHDDIKVATDLIRGDLATVLLLQIPSEAAGDND
ncbi:MAG: imelysin family protein [Proteobacteria bacterium]|nr:imelysin family protein [Pseudomonadota bacterium]